MKQDKADRKGTGRTGGTAQISTGGLLTGIASHSFGLIRRGILGGRQAARDVARAKSAATTLEFAMVGTTFTLLLALVASFGVYFLRLTMLDLAVQKVSRIVLMDQSVTKLQFLSDLQTASLGLLQGQTLYVAVQSASSFGAIAPVANISSGGSGTLPYSTGSNGSAVLIQVGYQDSMLTHLLPSFLTNVSSSVAFQIEPAQQ